MADNQDGVELCPDLMASEEFIMPNYTSGPELKNNMGSYNEEVTLEDNRCNSLQTESVPIIVSEDTNTKVLDWSSLSSCQKKKFKKKSKAKILINNVLENGKSEIEKIKDNEIIANFNPLLNPFSNTDLVDKGFTKYPESKRRNFSQIE